jgi:hypothetical protein
MLAESIDIITRSFDIIFNSSERLNLPARDVVLGISFSHLDKTSTSDAPPPKSKYARFLQALLQVQKIFQEASFYLYAEQMVQNLFRFIFN